MPEKRLQYQTGNRAETLVSILVPKLVIDFFEIIHIKEYNRPITQGLQMLDFIFIGAAVKQTGQGYRASLSTHKKTHNKG